MTQIWELTLLWTPSSEWYLLGSAELISQQSFKLHFDECFSLSIGTKYFGTVAFLCTVSKLLLFIHSLYIHRRNQKCAVYTLGRSFQADMHISSRTTKIGWNGQNILQIGNFSKTENRGGWYTVLLADKKNFSCNYQVQNLIKTLHNTNKLTLNQ